MKFLILCNIKVPFVRSNRKERSLGKKSDFKINVALQLFNIPEHAQILYPKILIKLIITFA